MEQAPEARIEALLSDRTLCRFASQSKDKDQATSRKNDDPVAHLVTKIATACLWLGWCTQEHRYCWTSGTGWLPTRLLDVRDLNGASSPCLVNGSLLDPCERYAALSHRWGILKPLVLTAAEVNDFESGIRWQDIPKTFQDAMIITKACGLRYIWIDSLCIIQDSHDDWKQESMTMNLVYRNSFFTISALGASNSSDGCFFERGEAWGSTRPWEALCESPLWNRGWVFQERLLSPRLLHFGKRQAMFECNNGMYGETDYQTRLAKLRPYWLSVELQPLNLWRNFVMQYSSRILTKPEDRAIAISGVAMELASRWPNECGAYCAGLWRRDLLEHLLWAEQNVDVTTQTSQRSPSWSWTSIDAPVYWGPGQSGVPVAEITRVEFDPQVNPYSSINKGLIHLKAFLWKDFRSLAENSANIIRDMCILDTSRGTHHAWQRYYIPLLRMRNLGYPTTEGPALDKVMGLVVGWLADVRCFSRLGIFRLDTSVEFPEDPLSKASVALSGRLAASSPFTMFALTIC